MYLFIVNSDVKFTARFIRIKSRYNFPLPFSLPPPLYYNKYFHQQIEHNQVIDYTYLKLDYFLEKEKENTFNLRKTTGKREKKKKSLNENELEHKRRYSSNFETKLERKN